MVVAAKVAAEQGLTEGYRAVINEGKHGGECPKSFFAKLSL